MFLFSLACHPPRSTRVSDREVLRPLALLTRLTRLNLKGKQHLATASNRSTSATTLHCLSPLYQPTNRLVCFFQVALISGRMPLPLISSTD